VQAVVNSDGARKEKKRSKSSLGEHLRDEVSAWLLLLCRDE